MILVCPTAFKGTIAAADAAAAMAAGVRDALPDAECVVMPVSDGGPGLVEALAAAVGGVVRVVSVHDPLGREVDARILLLELDGERSAVVECADACGMHLLAEAELDPMRLGSGGVGELIAAAARLADTVVIGLGGSATVDGGAGMASALGYGLLDDDGRALDPGGAALRRLARIELPDSSHRRPRVIGLADVRNPLVGMHGAARVFGPQKGASPDDVELLDAGLARLAEVVRRDVGIGIATMPGGGAAGGLGAAVVAFLGGTLEPGADRVLDIVGFDEKLARATLVVTGEGSWDAQSSMGKVTGEVVTRCGDTGVPVLLIAGHAHGEAPEHVTVATGEGALLDGAALRRVAAREVGRLGQRSDPRV